MATAGAGHGARRQDAGAVASKEEGDTKPEQEKAIKELEEYRERAGREPARLRHDAGPGLRGHARGGGRERAAGRVAARHGGRGVRRDLDRPLPAYLSCIPGNVAEARRYRAPGRAAGRERAEGGADHAARAPGTRATGGSSGRALFRAETPSGVPYDFVLNMPGRDVGHFVVIGQTGAGKSTLLALIALMFLAYEGARVVIFDKKRSSMVAVLCAGGVWIELAPGRPGVQPLRHVDGPRTAAGRPAGSAAVAAQGVAADAGDRRRRSATAAGAGGRAGPGQADAHGVVGLRGDEPRGAPGPEALPAGRRVRRLLRRRGPTLRQGADARHRDRPLDVLGRHAPLAMGAVFWPSSVTGSPARARSWSSSTRRGRACGRVGRRRGSSRAASARAARA